MHRSKGSLYLGQRDQEDQTAILEVQALQVLKEKGVKEEIREFQDLQESLEVKNIEIRQNIRQLNE